MSTSSNDQIEITIDGEPRAVAEGTTVLAALLNDGGWIVRRSITGESRGPLCGMGVCYECRAKINGVPHERACMVLCKPGMVIVTDFVTELSQAATDGPQGAPS